MLTAPPHAANTSTKDAHLERPLRLASQPMPPPEFGEPAAERAAKLAALIPKLEKLVDDHFAREKPPSLAVAMIVDGPDNKRGQVVFRRVLGMRDVASKTPATERTLYRIGSVTKTFTSAAILSLRDAGLLRLDDAADTYVPELARVEYPHADAPRITIRHLLTHTSGLPRIGGVDYTRPDLDVTEEEIFADLEKTRLERAPGTKHSYSNLAVGLLGIVARRAAMKSFRATMSERITIPLGMTSTTFDPKSGPPSFETATGYEKHTSTTPAKLWRLGAEEGAGGLWSSLDDMAKWIAFQLAAWPARGGDADAGPLKRASLRESHIASFPIDLDASVEGGGGSGSAGSQARVVAHAESVGLGWHTSSTCAWERLVKHSGGIDGFSSSVGFAPDHGFGFVVLMNSLDSDAGALRDALFAEVASSRSLSARVPQPAPELVTLTQRITAFKCDEAEFESVFTPAFRTAFPFAKYQPICKKLATRHGACTVPPMNSLDDGMSGTIKITCERGEMSGHFSAVHTPAGARFQGLRFRSRGFVAPKRLYDAAVEVMRLEAKWDPARFTKVNFAPDVSMASLEAGLAALKKEHGVCRLASGSEKSIESDGAENAVFDLQCERGSSVQLTIGIDDAASNKIDEARFKPKSSTARCVDPAPVAVTRTP